MIGNTLEYLYANALIMEIMDMIEGDSNLHDLKPICPSDVVNLSLRILKIFMGLHAESLEDNQNEKTLNLMTEFSEYFINESNIMIFNSKSRNETLQDVLYAIETIDDKDLLINKILSREILK